MNELEDIKVLHLIPDDKFLDSAMFMFDEALPGCNVYVVWNRDNIATVQYIKATSKISMCATWGGVNAKMIINRCMRREFDAILIHSWPDWRYVEALQSSGLPVFLFTWGHEIYGYIRQKDYMPETRRAMRKKMSWGIAVREMLSVARRSLLQNSIFQNRSLKTFLNVDCICPVIEDDYIKLKAKYGDSLKAKMMEFSYGKGADRDLPENLLCDDNGAVVVGNSETWTNNHLDIFKWLNGLHIKNKIIAPISYGNNPVVQKCIKDAGYKMFGEAFEPWTQFLPAVEYWQRLSSASYLVMGHLRQQAVGNIIAGLFMGMKVFFYDSSPVYQFLKRRGFVIYSINATKTEADFLSLIGNDNVKHNKELILKIWGHDAIAAKIEKILEAIRKRKTEEN